MRKYNLVFLVLFFTPYVLWGQGHDIKVETHTYEDTLKFDIYQPQEAPDQPRPVLIYVHGGGFSGGRRDAPDHQEFCKFIAEKGWVAVTMSYHLTMRGQSFGCDQPAKNKINTFKVASENIHSAVKYILDRKNEFNIDPETIVLAGSSAGAEAVLHAVYWRETKSGILPDSFRYGGVISMAGAILNKEWVNDSTAIPTQFFHGTCDPLVPYANSPHHFCDTSSPGFLMLYGGWSLTGQLRKFDKQFYMVTACGGGHEWAGLPIREYKDLIWDFLSKDVIKHAHRQTHIILDSEKESCNDRFDWCSN